MEQLLDKSSVDPALPLESYNHEKFCLEYANTGNAAQSYLKVYPNSSYDAARASSFHLLTNPNVRSRVDYLQKLHIDTAFATITRNFTAKKTIVHDADAVLTEVDDGPTQIAAATAVLKAHGRFGAADAGGNTYSNTLVLNSLGDVGQAAVLIRQMAEALASRTKGSGVIDVA